MTFPGGKTYDAKIVGRDARTDVGLLKVEVPGPAHRPRPGRLGQDRGRRVGHGGRQPVRPRRQQRHGGRRLLHGARHPARGPPSRDLRRDDPDRRRHQPGQLGRAALQHPGRGDRHQHHDHDRRLAGQRGRGLLGPDQRGAGDPAAAAGEGEGRARVDGRQHQPRERGPGRDLRPQRGQGRLRERGDAGLPRGEGRPAAGGRDPLRRRPHDPGQQRPVALHLLEEPGRDGQARRPAREGQEGACP